MKKSLVFIFALFASQNLFSKSYSCHDLKYSDQRIVPGVVYQIEASGRFVAVSRQDGNQMSLPEPLGQVGGQAEGGVFESRVENLSVYVDPSSQTPVRIEVKIYGLTASAQCQESKVQSLFSKIYEVSQSAEIQAAAQPVFKQFNDLYGRVVLQSMNDCKLSYWAFADISYQAQVQKKPLTKAEDLTKLLMYRSRVEKNLCYTFNHLYGASIFGWDGYGTSYLQNGLNSCREYLATDLQDSNLSSLHLSSEDLPLLDQLRNLAPQKISDLISLKANIFRFNRLYCAQIQKALKPEYFSSK